MASGKNKSSLPYEEVLVNDEYAYENPSFLVVSCEEDEPLPKVMVNVAIPCKGDGNSKFEKIGIPKVGEIGFDIENFEVDTHIDSKRTVLFDNWLVRDIFFEDNTRSDGHGLKGGFKIWHADHFYWTMPVTDITY